jgi:DNA-binding NtrC family response regulator
MSRILVVDDEPAARYGARRLLESAGHAVSEASSGEEMLSITSSRDFDVVLLDHQMGGMSGLDALQILQGRSGAPLVVFFTAQGSEKVAVEAMRRGAFDYLSKPADSDELVLVLERAASLARERTEHEILRGQSERAAPSRELVGDSLAMRRLREDLTHIAPSASSVLLLGESGTGKEMIARFLHDRSRRKGLFVPVHCGAIPAALVESELFGHEKGSFTGATGARPGRIRQAHEGTLFLDEIGDMPPDAQVRLLRVLEERVVEPVGSDRAVAVDIRVVAATHRDLRQMVLDGRFREDLLYRLDVLSIEIPPLRERPGDALLLARRFLHHYAGSRRLEFSPQAESVLSRWSWPGNVRELRNVVERASVLARTEVVGHEHLGLAPRSAPFSDPPSAGLLAEEDQAGFLRVSPVSSDLPFREAKQRVVEEFERKFISHHMERSGNNLSKAAQTLDMHRQSLQQKLKELGMARSEAQ